MQAHPLSLPAARTSTTPPPEPSALVVSTADSGTSPQPVRPQRPAHQSHSRVASGFLVGLASGLNSAFRLPHSTSEPPTPAETPLQRLPAQSLAQSAGLAHDAGNLLGALGLYCDLLQAPGVLRPEHRHYAVELRRLADRSGDMIRRLLGESLLPSSPVQCPPTNAAPGAGDLLREHASVLSSVAAPWATVSVEASLDLPPLPFPAEILERITVNLVRNAAEAIEKGRQAMPAHPLSRAKSSGYPQIEGHIRVSLRRASGRLRLDVEDNGPGLPPAIAAAFLRPAPLPAGVRRGLGHRIVHELAQSSGGILSIRVRPGRGTVISLAWPLDPEPLHAKPLDPIASLTAPAVHAPIGDSSTC